MHSRHDTGSVLMADIILGAAIVLVIAATASAAGTLAGAQQTGTEAARNGALWAARTGDIDRATTMASRIAPDAAVSVRVQSGIATAIVSTPVRLAHPILGRLPMTTTAQVAIPIAPYRSNRD